MGPETQEDRKWMQLLIGHLFLSGVDPLRANVWKYRATGGHSQNLFFAKIWFVDGYHCLNKCDIVCFLKYRLNFEKKVENLCRLLVALITHKIEAKSVAP